MVRLREWWARRRPTTRRLAQLYCALLYNANLKGFVDGEIFQGRLKAMCVPGLNCYSCPGAVGACPLGALQNALNAANHRAPWYVLGILMLFGLTLGRTICGWLCPMGLVQELLHLIPTPKIRKGRVTRALTSLKYVLLAVFVVALPIGYGARQGLPLPAFCKYICPAGTFEGAMGLLSSPENDGLFAALGRLFTQKFIVMLAVGLACIFCYRAFCRFLCPLGAIYGLFNKLAITGVKVDMGRCNHCGACVRHCEMDVRHVGDRECIACGKCMPVCAQGAISMKCGRLTLMAPETGKGEAPVPAADRRRRLGRMAWGVALAVLAFALLWFNIIHPQKAGSAADAVSKPAATTAAVEAGTHDSDAPFGWEVGSRLEDFECALMDGRSFRLSEHRGQVVFINLWATYCKPCVGELPYFDRLLTEHPEIEVIAIHSGFVTDDVGEYLADKGWDMDFAVDDEAGSLFRVVNGSSKLPQTIVLDGDGKVVYNEVRSVTYEMLLDLYAQAGG